MIRGSSAFFDDKRVIAAVKSGQRRALSRWGAYVRTSAKQSIRKRKKPSQPGEPPSSHVGTLKKKIYFAYDLKRRCVVVGPTVNGVITGVPKALEYGGTTSTGKLKRKGSRFSVGKPGPVRILGGSGAKWTRSFVWSILRSESQVRRANELYYDRYKERRVRIRPRPFMRPAMKKNLARGRQAFLNCMKPAK